MKPFDYAIATTRQAALEALSQGWAPKAGGVDVLDRLKERTETRSKLVGIDRIPELAGVAASDEGVELGPLVTLAELGAHPQIRARFPALARCAGEAATPQVREQATVGGNLLQRPRCHYFRAKEFHCLKKGGATCFAVEGEHDMHALFGGGPCHIVHPSNVAPALVAAGATLTVEKKGESRAVAADRFFVLPSQHLGRESVVEAGELLTKIAVPWPKASGYAEIRHKQSFDWPMATCAAVRRADGTWGVVLGAAAPIPWRAAAAEQVLGTSASPDEALAEKAAEAALKGAEPMARNAWRLKLVRAAVRRAVLAAAGKEVR